MRRADVRAALPTSVVTGLLAAATAAAALSAGRSEIAGLVGAVAFLSGLQGLRTD